METEGVREEAGEGLAVEGAMLAEEGGGVRVEEGEGVREEEGESGRSGKRALERVVVENSETVVDTSATEGVGEGEESREDSGEEVEARREG